MVTEPNKTFSYVSGDAILDVWRKDLMKEVNSATGVYDAIITTTSSGTGNFVSYPIFSQPQIAYPQSIPVPMPQGALMDLTIEVNMKNGDVISCEVEYHEGDDIYNSVIYWPNNSTFRIKGKNGTFWVINAFEYLSIKILSLEGKMTQVEKSLDEHKD